MKSVRTGIVGVIFACLLLVVGGCTDANRGVMLIQNKSNQEVTLHSEVLDGNVRVMPNSHCEVEVAAFRGPTVFWYLNMQSGAKVQMTTGTVRSIDGEAMWIKDSALTVDEGGSLSLHVEQVVDSQ